MLSGSKINIKTRQKLINHIEYNNTYSKINGFLNLKSKSKNKKINIDYISPSKTKVSTPLYKRNNRIYSKSKNKSSTRDKTSKIDSLIKSKKLFFSKESKLENKNSNYITSISCFINNMPSKRNSIYNSRNISNNFSSKKNIHIDKFSSKIISSSFSNNSINNKICNKSFWTDKILKINFNKNSVINENISRNKSKNITKQKIKSIKKCKISFVDGKNISKTLIKKKTDNELIKSERKVNELKNIKRNGNSKIFKINLEKPKIKENIEKNYKIQDFSFKKNSNFLVPSNNGKYIINNNNNLNHSRIDYIIKKIKILKHKKLKNKLNSNIFNRLSEEGVFKEENSEYETPHFTTFVE